MTRSQALIASAALSGCANSDGLPLIFVDTNTVGLTIAGAATEYGGELTLGYKSKSFAIVPVTIRNKDGSVTLVTSAAKDAEGGGDNALSVFGQFNLDAEAAKVGVGLGRFFATGLAADKLADGFKEKLSK